MFKAHVTYICDRCKKEQTYPCSTKWHGGGGWVYYTFESPEFGEDGDALYPDSWEEVNEHLLCPECREALDKTMSEFFNEVKENGN